MTARTRSPLCALVLGITTVAAHATQPVAVNSARTAVVNRLFNVELPTLSGGLPSANELSRLQLSDRLAGLFTAAGEYQDRWIAQHPDEPGKTAHPPTIHKPPFADGNFFTGSQDAVSHVEVTRTVSLGSNQWIVYVRLRLEPQSPGWENGVLVIRSGERYVIDDVFYDTSSSDNSPHRTLSRELTCRE